MIYYIRLDNDCNTTSNKQEAIITAINLIIKYMSYWYIKRYVDENDNDNSKSIMKTYIAINNKQYEGAISHFKGVGKVNFIFKEINNEFIENFDEETKKSYNNFLKESIFK